MTRNDPTSGPAPAGDRSGCDQGGQVDNQGADHVSRQHAERDGDALRCPALGPVTGLAVA